ncbi:fused MFS/spermidine synthase [Paenibacillus sp. HN-1]|uniref:spermidine synthase n=1 Tax=Paenibacillus TaxID=44249 RepID=UPI001CA82D48|nr:MULTISPECIES: fused MFS/spermidine synthase [Paenibacillus]MBY9079699.1 fused MFS/spermidine synthase [Paenibacillus sp. CGMCC 1.18879]MBY9082950.1 fused MFS/spermidine synthase [Paenibacillus sinensis]
MKVLYKTAEEGCEIVVADTDELYGEKGRFRVLQFSEELVQGALDLDQPERIVFEYPRAILHLMEWNRPGFEDVFLIGHGIGTLLGALSGKNVTTAELSQAVVDLSRLYFGSSAEDRIGIGDGRQLLEREDDGSLDYIVLDAFSGSGTPRHLISRGMFSLAGKKLNNRGMLIMNATGRGKNDRLIQSVHSTLASVFPYTLAFILPSADPAAPKNLILAGARRPIVYKSRQMAGFTEIVLPPGDVIRDADGGRATF